MKILLIAGLAGAAVALSACGTASLALPGSAAQADQLKTILDHVETCERHYHGQTVPPSLSIQIDCQANKASPAAPPPAAGSTPGA